VKIKHAVMEVTDSFGRPVGDYPRVNLKAKASAGERITLTVLDRDHSHPAKAEVRRYITDPDAAEEAGHESGDDEILVDWFDLVDADLVWLGDRLEVTGYMHGVEGLRRDGLNPMTGKPGAVDWLGDDRPLVRVRWYLS